MRKLINGPRLLAVMLGSAVTVMAMVGAGWATSQAPPTNTQEPQISGSAVVGQTLTTSNGTWTGNPSSFGYQWVRCPKDGGQSDGSNCAAIAGAQTKSYVVGSGDVGRTLRVRVTATNADGNKTVASNPTDVIEAAGEVTNSEPPTISGNATVGSTLTANPGKWEGGNNLDFNYTWRRCDAEGSACATITGANKKTYVVQQADRGGTLRVRVVAKSGNRSGSATSAATSRVTAGGGGGGTSASGCPSGSGTVDIAQIGSPARLLIDGQALSPSTVRFDTGALQIRVHVSACGNRNVQGALVRVAAVPFNQFSTPPEGRTGADGWATMTMNRQRGFPASDVQQLLVVFARARKGGEPVLGGISTRRLVSFPVNLSG